jgi:hypothetical protein
VHARQTEVVADVQSGPIGVIGEHQWDDALREPARQAAGP